MTADTIERLDTLFNESPVMCAEEVPSNEEVDIAEQQIGVPFPQDFRAFILKYGGAVVGPYPIFGLRAAHVMDEDNWSVVEVTKQLRQMGIDNANHWIMISEDHAGNPIGMAADGKVFIYDHDFDGVSEIATTFEEYLRRVCLKLNT
ncbi:SMI1/KNR4 family protein [Gimesia sp.]|uniref:SMI1/KNR4 family protein n=1 Tax=Gimesia sp. TaxID=2024833 RepID=UPI003A8CBA71